MIDDNKIHKWPRLYLEEDLQTDFKISLKTEHCHYLRNVLRREEGSGVRVFNAKYGEWIGHISFAGKKDLSLVIQKQIRLPEPDKPHLHLIFSPLKKDRLDFLIEKSVELGVTHLHPMIMNQSSVREINGERLQKQICEAAEQCERLDIPSLMPLQSWAEFFKNWNKDIKIFAALEREALSRLESGPNAQKQKDQKKLALLVGPEGGFSEEEKNFLLTQDFIKPISLGPNILRAETAAIVGLSQLYQIIP